MTAGCFVAGGAECLVAVAVVVTGVVGAESFGGTFLVDFVDHPPSPLPLLLQMGQCSSHFSVACLGITMMWGDCCSFWLFFCFDGGGRCGDWCRGNWPVLPGFKEIL